MAAGRGQVEAIISIIGEDKITQILSDVEKGLKDVEKKTDQTASATGGLRESWASVATGVNQVIELAKKAAALVSGAVDELKEGAKEQAIAAQFGILTKEIGGAGLALEALREASMGGIDETNMQRISSTALRMNMSLGQTVKMFELAGRAAHAGWGDQIELTEKFIGAISKRSDKTFKMIGLETDFAGKLAQTAKQLGISADALGPAAGRAIAYKDAVENLQGALDGINPNRAIQQLNQWEAEIENLKSAMRLKAMIEMGIGEEQVEQVRDYMSNLRFLVDREYQADPIHLPLGGWSETEMQRHFSYFAKARWSQTQTQIEFNKELKNQQQNMRHIIELGGIGKVQFDMMIQAHIRQIRAASNWEIDQAQARHLALQLYGLESIALEGLKQDHHAYSVAMAEGTEATTKLAEATIKQERAFVEMHLTGEKLWKALGPHWKEAAAGSKAYAQAQKDLADIMERTGKITKEQLDTIKGIIDGKYEDTRATDDVAKALERYEKQQRKVVDDAIRMRNQTAKNMIVQAQYADSIGETAHATVLYKKAMKDLPKSFKYWDELDPDQIQRIAIATNNVAAQTVLLNAAAQKSAADAMKLQLDALTMEKAEGITVPGIGHFESSTAARAHLSTMRAIIREMHADARKLMREKPTLPKRKKTVKPKKTPKKDALYPGTSLTVKEWEQMQSQMAQSIANFDAAERKRWEGRREFHQRNADEIRAIHEQLAQVSRDSMLMAVGDAQSFGNRWAAGFASSLPIIDAEITRFVDIQDRLKKATGSAEGAMVEAAPGMIAAAGQITGAFIKDTKDRAIVMGLFELAASAQAFANMQYQNSAMHALASTLYFAVAGTAKKGGGGARGGKGSTGKYTAAQMTPSAKQGKGGGTTSINLNFSGTIVGNDEQAARQLSSMIRRELRWSGGITPSGVQ